MNCLSTEERRELLRLRSEVSGLRMFHKWSASELANQARTILRLDATIDEFREENTVLCKTVDRMLAANRYEAAITTHAKAATADEENRMFDEVVAAIDEYRGDIRREIMLYNHYITLNGRPPMPLEVPSVLSSTNPVEAWRALPGNSVPSDFYQPNELRNHRCSIDHSPCPACELLEEREYERESGL
jgi:hypothetical protein